MLMLVPRVAGGAVCTDTAATANQQLVGIGIHDLPGSTA